MALRSIGAPVARSGLEVHAHVNAPAFAVRLLVCGNADRGDEGAALLAVAHVLPRMEDAIRHRIDVRRCPRLEPDAIAEVPPGQACVVVDTLAGIDPGSTVAIPLATLAGDGRSLAPRSSPVHTIGEVLGLAAASRGELPDGVLVGIGGKRFGFGPRRSRALSGGMTAFEEAIEGEVRKLTAERDATADEGTPPGSQSGPEASIGLAGGRAAP